MAQRIPWNHHAAHGMRVNGWDQRGITGLETAIILIAFVVVSSVLAYTVVTAGLFASDQGKTAVHAGLQEVQGSLSLLGTVKADGLAATSLSTGDAASSWTASANVTVATEAADRKEGTASVRLTVAAGFTTGIAAYTNFTPVVNLSAHYAAGLWIKSSASTASGDLRLLLDDTAACVSPLETLSIPALTANTWRQVNMRMTAPSALAAVTCVAIQAATDPGVITITVDQVEGPAEVQQLHLTFETALAGAQVSFIGSTDTDSDGLLSDEGTKNHRLIVSFQDANQMIHDIAWTATALGRNDGDAVLESGEKMTISVSLRALDPLPVARSPITLHVRPDAGAAVILPKLIPDTINTSMLIP